MINNVTNVQPEMEPQADTLGLPLAQRWPQRVHQWLSLHFRDVLPKPPPPTESHELNVNSDCPPCSPAPKPITLNVPVPPLCQVFKTKQNKFGLFHIYNCQTPPSHDPVDPSSVTYAIPCPEGAIPRPHADNPFHPYPNENSFLLGHWYWNHGGQKSRKSFQWLLEIIRSLDFHPEDVWDTKWLAIDHKLGNVGQERPEDSSGWNHTTITISIPFHNRCQNPGPKIYSVPDFHSHSLLSITHNNISNPSHHSQFHYEPYKLHWHPPHRTTAVWVYGELFTSQIFLEAHKQLQTSPREPGCDLPCHIVGLMFWSDSTQLMSFGDAKLWPLYACTSHIFRS